MNTITMDAETLLRALRAVLPHAGQDPEFPAVRRVRIDINDGLLVYATDRYTAGCVHIPAADLEDYTGDIWTFDLSPEDARLITSLFKPGKEESSLLRIDVDDTHLVTITDVGGLFAGTALTVPEPAGADQMPNMTALIRKQLEHTRAKTIGAPVWATTGSLWARFSKTSAVLKETVVIETVEPGKPFIIRCGEAFIGLLMPQRVDEWGRDEQVREVWIDRLPDTPQDEEQAA